MSLLLVLLVISSTTGVAMEIKPIMAKERVELHKDISIIKVDPALKNLTPYWVIIAAGSMENGKSAIFKYIDSSKTLTKDEKLKLKKFVKELGKKYPVKIIKKGRVTLITLAKYRKLTEEEKAMLRKVAQAVNEYFRTKYDGEVGILWNADIHQDIIYISCKKWGVSDYYAGIARDHADDPDQWYQVSPPPGYPDWMWEFIMQVVWSWTHYYNPSYCLPNGICVPTGAAPSECKKYADIARDKYLSGDKDSAYENLGYASHFLTDVGNPLHTGAELRQVTFEWIHHAYENYVSANWNSGYKFKSIVEDNWYYYPINDPEQATKDLAEYSHNYVETLFWTIFLNPDTWQSDSTVKQITENCLLETAKYALGLVKYVRG